jgi:hypothetical protein
VIAVHSETLEQGHYTMQRKPQSEIATWPQYDTNLSRIINSMFSMAKFRNSFNISLLLLMGLQMTVFFFENNYISGSTEARSGKKIKYFTDIYIMEFVLARILVHWTFVIYFQS